MTNNKQSPQGQLVLRTLAMPSDTNPAGQVFGGWIMSQMDLGGGMLAQEIARGRTVTVNASSISFLKPASVGDVICCYARCLKTGTSSITIATEIWVKKVADTSTTSQRYCITEAEFTYVCVDKHGKTRSLPEQLQKYDCEKDNIEKLGLSHC
ncbi:acyl-CoA thioester hydrolase YciA [Orbaceae bacterium ac157xtp]